MGHPNWRRLAIGLLRIVVGLSTLPALLAAQEMTEAPGPLRARVALYLAEVTPPRGAFSMNRAAQGEVALGWKVDGRHSVELGVGYLQREETEEWGGPAAGEVSLRVSARAFPVRVSYLLSLPVSIAWFRPFVSGGVDWFPVTDRWQSDTPAQKHRSSLWGVHLFLGLEFPLGRTGLLDVRAGHRCLTEGDRRPGSSVGLEGYVMGVGVGVRF